MDTRREYIAAQVEADRAIRKLNILRQQMLVYTDLMKRLYMRITDEEYDAMCEELHRRKR